MALVLLDEYLKEGYWLKPSDFLKPELTHENLLLALGLVALALWARKYFHRRPSPSCV